MVSIVQQHDPVLRELAQTIPLKDIESPKIKAILADMSKALSTQDDGVALAAPQIGKPLRIFIVSGKVLSTVDDRVPANKDLVFINPEITKISKEKQDVEEGCLSCRYLYGRMVRAKKVTLKAYDETGKLITRGASGFLAQIFQHEVDHLNGILFIDSAYDLQDNPPEDKKKTR